MHIKSLLVVVFILTGFSGSYVAQESALQQSLLWTYESQDNIEYYKPTPSGDLLVSSKSKIALLSAGTGEVVWSRDDNIEYFELTASGDLFVSSKSEIALVSAKTGEVVWSRDDIRDCKVPWVDSFIASTIKCLYLEEGRSVLTLLSNTPYALFTTKERLVLLDWRTGATSFDSADHPLGKVRDYWYISQLAQFVLLAEIKKNSYALAAIKAGDSELQWLSEITISKDFKWLGVQGDSTAVVYGKNRDGKQVLAALNLDTGEVTWQTQDLLKEKVKNCCFAPIYDTEETMILFISKDGPMRLDTDGQLLWRAQELARKDPSKMMYADGVLFIPQDDRVFAIDTSDGSTIWEEETRFDPTIIEIHSRGLFIASGKKLDLLDLQTGKPAWTKEVKMSVPWYPGWFSLSRVPGVKSPIVVGSDALYFAAAKALTVLNLEDGSLNEIAHYKFEDKQLPVSLTLIEGDFFLNGAYEVASFDSGGQLLYQRYYKPPGASGWAKVGAFALEVGAGLAQGYLEGQERKRCYEEWQENKPGNQRCQGVHELASESFSRRKKFESLDEVQQAWNDDVQAAWRDTPSQRNESIGSFAENSFRATLSQRFGTTVDAGRFIHMYFEEKDRKDDDHRFGLVRFDKRKGKEVGRLWLNERKPEYTLDLATQTVFFKSSDKMIQALKFEENQ